MTAEERRYITRVAALSCLVCGNPAVQIHHVRRYGETRKHSNATPLCWLHHQGPEGIHHIGKREWERRYMSQDDLLAETNRRLEGT